MSGVVDVFGRAIAMDGDRYTAIGAGGDGITVQAPSLEAALTIFGGMAPPGFTPPPPPPPPTSMIDTVDFIARFTAAEQAAIMAAAATSVSVALWRTRVFASVQIDVGTAEAAQAMAALVGAGLMTTARVARVLDLTQVSP